jgi:AcrR family transcriptional regulator
MVGTQQASRPARRKRGLAQTHAGVRRDRLGELQRARIIAAMLDLATDGGVSTVSVAHVVERSGVSRRTFYQHFTDRDDCFRAAFEQALSYASQCVIGAYRAEKTWRGRIRAGLIALLSFLDEEPAVARVLIIERLSGPRALRCRGEALARVASAVDEGRAEASGTHSSLTAEGVLGGVLAVIQARLDGPERTQTAHIAGGRDGEPLIGLTNQLMSMIVLPYLGPQAARRELERPLPASTPLAMERNGSFLSDPFKEAGMRLTYRTVRALLAIAEHPHASNRLVGEEAGIADQGQISKLLGRLEQIGLVQNTVGSVGQGGPNAWSLTTNGQRIVHAIGAHTQDAVPNTRETR